MHNVVVVVCLLLLLTATIVVICIVIVAVVVRGANIFSFLSETCKHLDPPLELTGA